jgi:hypothetical protein
VIFISIRFDVKSTNFRDTSQPCGNGG